MSLESLAELLRPEAEEVEVGGNLPFRLAPADAAWFLAAGKVEVFAVRLGEDGSEGPGTAARASQGVVWVRHVRGRSAFLGIPELALSAEEYLLPLAERTWLESASPVELSAVDTRILLRGGGLWEGLAHYHELFL